MKKPCYSVRCRKGQKGHKTERLVIPAVVLFLFLLFSTALAQSPSSTATETAVPVMLSASGQVASSPALRQTDLSQSLSPGEEEGQKAVLAADAAAPAEAASSAVPEGTGAQEDGSWTSPDEEGELPGLTEEKPVHDPLEPWNRLMFHFNDKMYYWVLRPASKGYNAVLPQPVRTSVANFFRNVTTPVRFVSSLLAGRVKEAGVELARFGINTTAGLGGLFDVARQYNLQRQESDLGLTFGRYGIGEGIYLVWPFLGPSTLRDTVGTVGDAFLDPVNYITPRRDAIAVNAYEYFNYAALHVEDYEDFKRAAVEPYVALRNAYIQHRRSIIRK